MVDVRAIGVHSRGVRHWVHRAQGERVTDQPALCGQTAARGWVAGPDHWSHDCAACLRKVDEVDEP